MVVSPLHCQQQTGQLLQTTLKLECQFNKSTESPDTKLNTVSALFCFVCQIFEIVAKGNAYPLHRHLLRVFHNLKLQAAGFKQVAEFETLLLFIVHAFFLLYFPRASPDRRLKSTTALAHQKSSCFS